MPLNPAQQRVLEEWMRSKAIVMCPCCGQDKWRLTGAAYVRALLEESAEDLVEAAGGGEDTLRQLRVRGAL